MFRPSNPGIGVFSDAGPTDQGRATTINELIELENRMSQLLIGRQFPNFFKTPDEIEADFGKKSPTIRPEFIHYSDTLDGCMNIQQSIHLTSGGYMEENY